MMVAQPLKGNRAITFSVWIGAEMVRQKDPEHVIELIEHIEADIAELKRALGVDSKPINKRQKGKTPRSLYGIFPKSETTWEDFRAARRSWSRHQDESK
jgi:hypothetical protein